MEAVAAVDRLELFLENQSLVYAVIRRHYGFLYGRSYKQWFEDAVQEGMLGLWIACCRFDPERGNKLDTYAWHWIRRYVGRCVAYVVFRCPTVSLEQAFTDGNFDPEVPEAVSDDLREEVLWVLRILPGRQGEVIQKLYLEGKKLHEVAKEWGVSKQRVGAIAEEAKKKLWKLFRERWR